jgi:hypothetical protein
MQCSGQRLVVIETENNSLFKLSLPGIQVFGVFAEDFPIGTEEWDSFEIAETASQSP